METMGTLWPRSMPLLTRLAGCSPHAIHTVHVYTLPWSASCRYQMWRSWIVLALCLSLVMAQEEEEEKPTKLPFRPPSRPSGDVYFVEPFVNPDEVWRKWVKSAATKEGADSDVAKYNGR